MLKTLPHHRHSRLSIMPSAQEAAQLTDPAHRLAQRGRRAVVEVLRAEPKLTAFGNEVAEAGNT